MKEINSKLFFRVGECTEVSKLTFYKTKELGYCSRVSVMFRLKTSIVTTVTSWHLPFFFFFLALVYELVV